MYEILSHLELSQSEARNFEILDIQNQDIKIILCKIQKCQKNSKVDIVFDTDLQFLSNKKMKTWATWNWSSILYPAIWAVILLYFWLSLSPSWIIYNMYKLAPLQY